MARIEMVLKAKRTGLTLDDIRVVLSSIDADSRHALLDQRRAELRRRIAQMNAALELLDCAAQCRHDAVTDCPHVSEVRA